MRKKYKREKKKSNSPKFYDQEPIRDAAELKVTTIPQEDWPN